MTNGDRHEPVESLSSDEQYLVAWVAAQPELLTRLRVRGLGAWSDDIIADTAAKAWMHRAQYTGRGKPAAWFMRLCQSAAREYLTREARIPMQSVDRSSLDDVAAAEYSESGEYRRLRLEDGRIALIYTRSTLQQQIVTLRAEGLRFAQIAKLLCKNKSTVRNLYRQTRTWLRAHDPAGGETVQQ